MQTLVLWNIRWRPPQSPAGQTIRAIVAREKPDLVCLTEAHAQSLADPHPIASAADFGPGFKPARRKVPLWSRRPWLRVDATGPALMPKGRFVEGETETPLGLVRVIGVCVPYSEAMTRLPSSAGGLARWEAHHRYRQGLAAVVDGGHDA